MCEHGIPSFIAFAARIATMAEFSFRGGAVGPRRFIYCEADGYYTPNERGE
jgi:hypothetical protein